MMTLSELTEEMVEIIEELNTQFAEAREAGHTHFQSSVGATFNLRVEQVAAAIADLKRTPFEEAYVAGQSALIDILRAELDKHDSRS